MVNSVELAKLREATSKKHYCAPGQKVESLRYRRRIDFSRKKTRHRNGIRNIGTSNTQGWRNNQVIKGCEHMNVIFAVDTETKKNDRVIKQIDNYGSLFIYRRLTNTD